MALALGQTWPVGVRVSLLPNPLVWFGSQVINLVTKMVPSWSQNGIKIVAKIESFFDAFENQIVMGF